MVQRWWTAPPRLQGGSPRWPKSRSRSSPTSWERSTLSVLASPSAWLLTSGGRRRVASATVAEWARGPPYSPRLRMWSPSRPWTRPTTACRYWNSVAGGAPRPLRFRRVGLTWMWPSAPTATWRCSLPGRWCSSTSTERCLRVTRSAGTGSYRSTYPEAAPICGSWGRRTSLGPTVSREAIPSCLTAWRSRARRRPTASGKVGSRPGPPSKRSGNRVPSIRYV